MQHDSNLAWQATIEGNYEAACLMWEAILSADKRFPYLNNFGITLLLAGNTERAVEIFREARNMPPKHITTPLLGAALWLNGEFESACNEWNQEIQRLKAKEIVYTDAAGGVRVASLLWWSATHNGFGHWRKVAEDELKLRLHTSQSIKNWPRPVATFLLGNIQASKLFIEAQNRYSNVAEVQNRESCFYAGAKYLALGDTLESHKAYANTISANSNLVARGLTIARAEYHLASYELKFNPT